MTDNLKIVADTVKKAESEGASQAEAFFFKEKLSYLTIELGEVKFREVDEHMGLAVTVLKNKSLGFSYTSKISKDTVAKIVKDALSVASVKAEDKNFKGFPKPAKMNYLKDVLDPDIMNLSPEKAVELGKILISGAKEADSRVIPTFGAIEARIRTKAIANSYDLQVEETYTSASIGLRTLLKIGEEAGNGYDFDSSGKIAKLDPHKIGLTSGKLAASSVKTKKIETQRTTVILEPHAVAGVFGSVLSQPLLGNLIQEQRSVFSDRLGAKVAVDSLNIVDDGTMQDGYHTSSFDDEGVAKRKNTLIEKGVIKGILYNTFYGRKSNTDSTGNCVRSGGYTSGGRPYRNQSTVGVTNFIVSNGTKPRQKLIDETKNGVLITFAVGGGSPVTGDFSTDARNIYKIKDGEITYAIKQGMYTGNILETLNKIVDYSSERRFSGGLSPGGIYAPVIKIEDGTIIGT